jgi:hypothetical protein
MTPRAVLFLGIFFSFRADAAGPPATELVCTLVGGGLIQIDGLLDDWGNMPELTKAGADPSSAALALRCAYDTQTLYLMVNVTDDRLIRTRARTEAEDHLVFRFGSEELEVWPGSAEAGAKLAWEWRSKRGPKVAVADSLQKRGWSVEIALPLARTPGHTKGAPAVPIAVELHDADMMTERRIQSVVATGEVRLSFEEAAASLKQLLGELHLGRADLTLDTLAEMDGEPGLERVVAGGRYVGVVGTGWIYLELPVASPRDVLSVAVADLGGGGKSSLVVRTVERGNGGAREVLSIWDLHGGGFQRTFAHEIAKQLGGARLTNVWELVPRGKGKRGLDLVIRPGDTGGFTEATWRETPASDMMPILLPWGPKKQELWHFAGDEVSGG